MDAHASRVGSLVFASLVTPGRDGGYAPYLARNWTLQDQRTWHFQLDSRFTFHDGSRVTAHDVVATYAALLDPQMGSPRRGVLRQVAAVEAPTPEEVVFRLHGPDAAFLEAATLAVLPAGLATDVSLEPLELVGAGPYRIAALEDDRVIRLHAYPGFALGAPAIEAVELRIVPDALMRALELRHGSLDFVQNALDPDTVEWISTHVPQLVVHRGPSSVFQYMGMNFAHRYLADVRVRRALAYAIDRERIVHHVLEGQARVAAGMLAPEHWAYAAHQRRYRYDPERARRLLDRAGLADPDGAGPLPRFTLGYKTTTDELARRTAEVIAGQLAEIGIALEIRTYEWGTFFSDVRSGRFDLYSLRWIGITDPDLYRQIFHSSSTPPAGLNRGHYRNPRMDRLADRAAVTTNREARRRLYVRVQRLAARDLPCIPLWWPERVVVATERLEDFTPHPSGDLFELFRARLSGAGEARAGPARRRWSRG